MQKRFLLDKDYVLNIKDFQNIITFNVEKVYLEKSEQKRCRIEKRESESSSLFTYSEKHLQDDQQIIINQRRIKYREYNSLSK